MYCNHCGSALLDNATACATCGSRLPASSASVATSQDDRKARRWAVILTLVFGAFGIVWDVLAFAVLFHGYSFFESVVVCLLVMILCVAATVRAEFEAWSGVFQNFNADKDPNTPPKEDHDSLHQLRGHVKVLFYAIAFLMALVKLVMTLFA